MTGASVLFLFFCFFLFLPPPPLAEHFKAKKNFILLYSRNTGDLLLWKLPVFVDWIFNLPALPQPRRPCDDFRSYFTKNL